MIQQQSILLSELLKKNKENAFTDAEDTVSEKSQEEMELQNETEKISTFIEPEVFPTVVATPVVKKVTEKKINQIDKDLMEEAAVDKNKEDVIDLTDSQNQEKST